MRPSGARIPHSAWLKIVPAFTLALVAVSLVPRGGQDGATPPMQTLLLTGVLVSIATTVGLYFALVSDLGLPARIAVFAVAYNGLVVLVKFVLAPHGLYEVNQEVDLDGLIPLDDWTGASLAASLVFALYAAAYLVVHRLFGRPASQVRAGRWLRRPSRKQALVALGALAFLVVSGGWALVLVIPVLLLAGNGLQYIDFVFSSGVSLLVAAGLAAATGLAALAFRGTAQRADLVGNAALVASVFWIGLAFLALYHALWVVYVVVLTSIWPLRTVVPK